MKNRLEIAHDLLSNNGSLWINIDDDEANYLKVLMDEIFGRENLISNVIWKKKYSPQNDAKYFSDMHDHILVFAKSKENYIINQLPRSEEMDKRYKNPDNDPRGPWKSSDFSKQRGTGKFIGYPIKEYIGNSRKRVPNYDTGRAFQQNDPQTVQRYELKEDYYVYDSAIINLTEKQLIDRIAERVSELKEQYRDVYLIRFDENMHRESAKNNKLKLHQFGSGHDEINLAGFQPDFILYLQNADYFIQIFIEPKGRNIEEEQWKEDLLMYINEHEAEIVFEDEITDVRIKGVKFYTMNDGRGAIKQLGEIALGRAFKGLSVE